MGKDLGGKRGQMKASCVCVYVGKPFIKGGRRGTRRERLKGITHYPRVSRLLLFTLH